MYIWETNSICVIKNIFINKIKRKVLDFDKQISFPVFVGTTCLSQNYCKFNKNPCLHGGTCNDVVNSTFSCSCLSGYTGSICQHNIDDCASVTCLNGGTCVDQVDSFTCSCAEGFSGKQFLFGFIHIL